MNWRAELALRDRMDRLEQQIMQDEERAVFEAFHAAHAAGEAAATEYVDVHEKIGGLVTLLVACTDPALMREVLIQIYVDGYARCWADSRSGKP
mgnify:CR=1 FL=1